MGRQVTKQETMAVDLSQSWRSVVEGLKQELGLQGQPARVWILAVPYYSLGQVTQTAPGLNFLIYEVGI